MLEELKTKKETLKSTEKPKERKIHRKIVEDVKEFEKLLKETNFEDYYETIRPYTFNSTIIPLKHEIIEEIYNLGNEFKKNKTRKSLSQKLQQFGEEIDQNAKDNININNGMFIRISTISPKDAVLTHENFPKNIFAAYNMLTLQEEEWKKEGREFLMNEEIRRIHALYIASTSTMKIQKGIEGIQLLIESERTQQEFKKFMKYGEIEYPIKLIIREFANFDVEMEFRGFIYNVKNEDGSKTKKLTGLTQYNNFCYFPKLILKQDSIQNSIRDFVNQEMIPNVQLENFVIDIVLIENEKNYNIKIIEINPFGEFCGGGMFNWDIDFEKYQKWL
eukprot:gene3534-6269_t